MATPMTTEIDTLGTWTQARRLAVLRRYAGEIDRAELHAAYPGAWPETDAGERTLSRDLATLGWTRRSA